MELISCQLLCLMMHRVLSPRKDLFTIALNWKCLNERGERDRNPFTHTHTHNPGLCRRLLGLLGLLHCQYMYVIKSMCVFPLAIIVVYVGVVSCHCSELWDWEPAGLLIAYVCVCVWVRERESEWEWEREIDRERQGWVTQQREKHKRALP